MDKGKLTSEQVCTGPLLQPCFFNDDDPILLRFKGTSGTLASTWAPPKPFMSEGPRK
ncbi:hypothetical protein A2U01_0049213, partial [Trifolium medium]|nr:hypothetical protein [Trifolium medium]